MVGLAASSGKRQVKQIPRRRGLRAERKCRRSDTIACLVSSSSFFPRQVTDVSYSRAVTAGASSNATLGSTTAHVLPPILPPFGSQTT